MRQQPDEFSRQGVRQNEAVHAASLARSLGAVLRMQTLVSLLLALGLLLIEPVAAYSSLCGSVAVYVPGLLFTMLVSRKIGASNAAFLGTAALAEFGKFILTGVLCAIVFIWVRPLAPIWFFAGMLAVLITGWFGLARAVR